MTSRAIDKLIAHALGAANATTSKVDEDSNERDVKDDWDERFWAPAENKCFRCMPPSLAEIRRQWHRQALGPVGYTGTMRCVVCSNWRSHGLDDDRTEGLKT